MTARAPRDITSHCPECGWASKETTAGLAAHALNLHSCDRTRRLAAAAERGRQMQARIDRSPQPCHHKEADHQHGHYATYVLDRCRCLPCVADATAWKRNQVRKSAQGRWQPYVDAQPVRAHVQQLQAAGMGWKTVAAAAGISATVVCSLLYGKGGRQPSQRVRPGTARALLDVTQPTLAPGALVDATGTWRRLHALVAIGWPKAHLAERLGCGRSIQIRTTRVEHGTAEKVRALYDQMQDTPGPSTRARNDAMRAGWLHPGWWDPDTIDDATYQPRGIESAPSKSEVDPVAVELATQGRPPRSLTVAERREVVRLLHTRGLNDQQLARQTGMTDRTVLRIRQELGLPAIGVRAA